MSLTEMPPGPAHALESAVVLRTLVASTPDLIFVLDREGRYVFVNQPAAAVMGFTPEQMIGRTWSELGLPADREPEFVVEREAVMATRIPAKREVTFPLPGGVMTFDYSVSALIGTGDEVQGVLVVSRDVTDRVRTERERSFLADASALLSESLDPDTVLTRLGQLAVPRLADWCAIDIAQPYERYRRLVVAHTDPQKEQLARDLDRDYPADPQHDLVLKVLRSGESQILAEIPEALVESAARDARHLELLRGLELRSVIVVPIRSGGKIYGALTLVSAESGRRFDQRDLALAEDVAARAGVAAYNAQLYVEAQAGSHAKDEFLATLSHELRTPMTAILGWARMMAMDDDPALAREAIRAIEKSARAQAQLIDDLLDVSRIDVGKLHLVIEDVDVGEIVQSAVNAVRPAANVKQVRIETTSAGDSMHVSGDANRLQQVIWNLVSNAVKFTAAGGAVAVATTSDADNVRIVVSDTGEGIEPKVLPFIFDRFRQADSSTTRRFGGLGLGLTIVKQITELHGGRVEAVSEGPGKGATFTITLPRRRSHDGEAPFSTAAVVLTPLNSLHVLVVDDDAPTRRYVATVLERAGAIVRTVESADAAIAAVRRSVPDVLLSDIAMPDRDGYALIEDVRRILCVSEDQLPAIAMTAFGNNTADRVRTLAAGFQRFLMKPIDPAELAKTVAEVATRPH